MGKKDKNYIPLQKKRGIYKKLFPLTEQPPQEVEYNLYRSDQWGDRRTLHLLPYFEGTEPYPAFRLMKKWVKELAEKGKSIEEIMHITDNSREVVERYLQRIEEDEQREQAIRSKFPTP